MPSRRIAPHTDQAGMFPSSDAEFLAALRQVADHLVARGEPEPGLPSIVRIAADELERCYAAKVTRRESGIDFADLLIPKE